MSIAAEVPQIFVRYNTPSQEGTGVNPARNSCGSSILGKLNDLSAGSSVHMLMYSLSFNDLITKLKDIATPERKVCIIVDKGQYNSDAMKDRVNELASHANIRIRVIGKPRNESSVTWRNEITLHEKSTLLKDGDKETLMIGSYNWSFAASARNYENCIFMERKTGGNLDINNVIAAAKTRFDELWK
ncbi:MAG: hypothetical protein FJX18_07315, partial [Alphaproteobacteria bacterium]|nr:hypothetical protein [Alphaproteobacteria bacterium]